MIKNKKMFLFIVFFMVLTAGVIIYTRGGFKREEDAKQTSDFSVLGKTSTPNQTHFNTTISPTTSPFANGGATPTPITSGPTPTPLPVAEYTMTLVDGPRELTEGDTATFTWYIDGPSKTIHTTTVYYGTTSVHDVLAKSEKPGDTHYTDALKDFLQGEYGIPLRFIGNARVLTPGTYFYRAYALIDGNHSWSGERTFVVKPKPRHEIQMINYPTALFVGANAAFTWDISGPAATTGFTVIVAGKESRPGALDASIDIPKTPYTVLVGDFTSGIYNVPLRFIGNAVITEPGVYYFRALAFINDKNIWSDEHSFTVQ